MKKQYRLKKDLPDYKAGETLTFNPDSGYYRFDNPAIDGIHGQWPPVVIESAPDWFELVEPKHKLLELLEREYDRRFKSPDYPKSDVNGFSVCMHIVRNYLQSELVVSEVKEEKPYYEKSAIFNEQETRKHAGLYNLLKFAASNIQPNAGDSYYVELGKLLDKHLREEK